jgi:hypothetical protein
VFDGTGKLVRRYPLQGGRRLIAVGKEAVYAVFQDEDGLEHVERYAVR